MGNCLVLEDKVIKVVRADGKVLEYKAPIRVHQILEQFSGYELLNSPGDPWQLHPHDALLGGNVYYLAPHLPSSPQTKKKKVRFQAPEEEGAPVTNVVRVKVVISKQELQMLLQGDSVEEVLSRCAAKEGLKGTSSAKFIGECRGWKPQLESIPETN